MSAVDDEHRRVACGCERTPYLKDEDSVGIALRIERERARQLCRRRVVVDAACERLSAELLSRQIYGGHFPSERIVRGGRVALGLERDRIAAVDGTAGDEARRKTGDRKARIDPEISFNGRRSSVGHRGASKHRETLCGSEGSLIRRLNRAMDLRRLGRARSCRKGRQCCKRDAMPTRSSTQRSLRKGVPIGKIAPSVCYCLQLSRSF